MKKYLAIGLILLTGCATNSNWQTTTGQTLETVAQTVEAARESYISYCNANNVGPTDPTFLKIEGVYGQYQQAMAIAENAYAAAAATNNTTTVAVFNNALIALDQSETNIVTLLK